MVVLVIIGILVLLALPNLQGLFGTAHSIEAQTQLKHLSELQKMNYQKRFVYSNDLASIGFDAPKTIEVGGQAKYTYEVIQANEAGFVAQARAIKDFDQDGQFNLWQIDQDGNLKEITPD
jgi:type IV pilus assembly protein PilE